MSVMRFKPVQHAAAAVLAMALAVAVSYVLGRIGF